MKGGGVCVAQSMQIKEAAIAINAIVYQCVIHSIVFVAIQVIEAIKCYQCNNCQSIIHSIHTFITLMICDARLLKGTKPCLLKNRINY